VYLALKRGGQGHVTKIAISQSFDEMFTPGLMRLIALLKGHAMMMKSDDLDFEVKVE
jgi:hypothetical protein